MSQGTLPQSLVLLLAGMVTVFIFLYILVVVMRVLAMIVPRFNHLLPEAALQAAPKASAPGADDDDTLVAVAIAAAFSRKRV